MEDDEHKKLSELDRLVGRFQDGTLISIGKAMAAWIRSLSPDGAPPTLETVRTAAFPDVSSDLLTNTEKLLAGSLLLGMDHASPDTTLADSDYTPLPFDEAIKFLKARVSLTKAEWAALEPKLAFRAFTMAKLTQCDYIEAVRGRLVSALETGEGFDQLWGDVKAIAESDGSTVKPGYWETVYRTNVQTAYNAGRRMQFDRDPPSALALMVLEDERTSAICRPLAGLVLPYNHPFWEDHWPPFHFNCRTTVRGIYDYEVGHVPVQNVPMKRLRKEFHPQSGFGENPIKKGTFYDITDAMQHRALHYGIMNDLKFFAENAGFRSARLFAPDSLDGFNLIQEYPSGGKVYKHESHKGKKLPEEDIAKRLAKEGREVKLLPRSNHLTSPDFIVDGEIWELKNIIGTSTSIDNALRNKQSENIILAIKEKKDRNWIFDEIKKSLKRRVNIKKVWYILPDFSEIIARQ